MHIFKSIHVLLYIKIEPEIKSETYTLFAGASILDGAKLAPDFQICHLSKFTPTRETEKFQCYPPISKQSIKCKINVVKYLTLDIVKLTK